VLDLNDPFLSPRSKPLTNFKLPSKPILMVSLDPDQSTPVLLADIPAGQAASGTDKLQWAPAANLIQWSP